MHLHPVLTFTLRCLFCAITVTLAPLAIAVAQATKALIGPPSFGQPDFPAAMAKIKAIPTYPEMFHRAFPAEQDPITPENWGRAIGAYERTLVTPSPFDAYLAGNVEALTPAARVGLWKFIETGCAGCRGGVGVGGGMYQKFGVVEYYWQDTHSKKEPGRRPSFGSLSRQFSIGSQICVRS